MAEIFPENIDDFINVTDGERRVFELLKSNVLPESEYIAWYEPRLQAKRNQSLKPDFIVWGNTLGLVILEVKDWNISGIKEWNDAEMKSNDGKSYKNPERQAIDYVNTAMANLQKKAALCINTGQYKGKLKFPVSYGVILTNITRSEFINKLGNSINSNKILFSDDLLKIENGKGDLLIEFLRNTSNIFSFSPLNSSEIDVLRAVLFPRIILSTNKNNQSLKVLDKEQEQEAWKIGPGHRIIKGVAGSGKTLLIAYRAKILKAMHPDYKILIICYNITLKKYIKSKIQEIFSELTIDDSNIDIYHFHDFAYKVIKDQVTNGHSIIRNIGEQKDWNVYQTKIGNILSKGIKDGEIKQGMYDAILIDECQDLTTDFLKFLLHVLNKETNHFLIAIDPAQNLYGGTVTWKEIGIQAKGRVKTLKKTYRNTKQILEFAYNFNPGRVIRLSESDTEVPLFPDMAERNGKKPVIQGFDNTRMIIDFIINSIDILKNTMSLGNIGIIFQTPKFAYYETLTEQLSVEHIPYKEIKNKQDKENFDFESNEVKLIGVHNVKGYEFHTIFLVGVDFIRIESTEMINLLYVGITRATDELIIPYLDDNRNKPYIRKMIEAT